MKKEESLIKVTENNFLKFWRSIRNFFKGLFEKKIEVKDDENSKGMTELDAEKATINTQLDDMEILAKVMNGEIKSKDLGKETQNRLIELCKKREEEIQRKIDKTNEQIEKIDNLLLQIDEVESA